MMQQMRVIDAEMQEIWASISRHYGWDATGEATDRVIDAEVQGMWVRDAEAQETQAIDAANWSEQ